MPIYEYQCIDCGQNFEKLVRFSDTHADTPECPGCLSENTRKRLSTIAAFNGGKSQASSAAGCGSSGPFR